MTYKPYMLKELIATPTTRMISRLPYIDPKVRNALKGISFLPPTTTPDYNVDSEVKNMLIMSMGRPAIQDQPYYQVDHDLSESKVDPMVGLFGFNPIRSENLDKSMISATNMEDQFENNNDNFIRNNQPNAIGKVRDNGNSLELDNKHVIDKNQKSKKERAKSKTYKLIERYLLEKKELQRERDEQMERNNQQFIEENNKSKLPKQSNREPSRIDDGGQTTPFIHFADPKKVPVVVSPKRPPELQHLDFDQELVKGTLLPLDNESESIKKPRLPIYYDPNTVKQQKRPSGFESETFKNQTRPSKIESNKTPQFSLDDDLERIKKPHLPSDIETESVYNKQSSSYEQTRIKKKQSVLNSDPDHDAFEMLDKVVNDIKPNRDNEEPYPNDEDNSLILEQSYLPTEDIPEPVSDSPNDDVQYVNIESVPMVPEAIGQDIKSPDAEPFIQETFVDWENVKDDSREKKRKPTHIKPQKAIKNKKILVETFDNHEVEKTTIRQNFREDAEGLTIKETNIQSHPKYPLPENLREKDSEPHYAPYRLKSSDHKSDRQYDTNEGPYRNLGTKTAVYNILDQANIGGNEHNNIDYTNSENKLDNIPLSMSDVSTQDETYFSEEFNSAASSNSFSEENGLEIDFPYQSNGQKTNKNVLINLNIKTKINNTQNLKDEFYHIFADVVSEIAVHSNATKQWNTN